MIKYTVNNYARKLAFSALRGLLKEIERSRIMYSSAYVWAKIISYIEEQLGAVVVSAAFDDAEVVELNEDNLILYSSSILTHENKLKINKSVFFVFFYHFFLFFLLAESRVFF